ncbi:hypothetical protein B0H16DRAFT_1838759 [Mycena metata]|uniref:Uncharacterized protein n=1 Tax=Mycena metata TaxID=1033252 RepID=A0AAD7K8W1_9AGAR|nr:hypothetical protein B0H16DRAFT_1838759 [Mycena metata]
MTRLAARRVRKTNNAEIADNIPTNQSGCSQVIQLERCSCEDVREEQNQWHPKSQSTPGRVAPLLVCRPFARIALPPFYHTLVLHSSSQARSCLLTLRARPELARAVRVLVLASSAPGKAEADVLTLLMTSGGSLKTLDITLPAPGAPSDALALAEALQQVHGLEALTIRKGPSTYLNQPASRAVLEACGAAVEACPEFNTLTLTFPLSPDPALLPLVAALSTAPALRTFACPMPAVWSPTQGGTDAPKTPGYAAFADSSSYPDYASSPARMPERRYTSPSASSCPPPTRRPILPTSLFLVSARSHTRLCQLIRAGTAIAPVGAYASGAYGGGWRGRAATVGSVSVAGKDESIPTDCLYTTTRDATPTRDIAPRPQAVYTPCTARPEMYIHMYHLHRRACAYIPAYGVDYSATTSAPPLDYTAGTAPPSRLHHPHPHLSPSPPSSATPDCTFHLPPSSIPDYDHTHE